MKTDGSKRWCTGKLFTYISFMDSLRCNCCPKCKKEPLNEEWTNIRIFHYHMECMRWMNHRVSHELYLFHLLAKPGYTKHTHSCSILLKFQWKITIQNSISIELGPTRPTDDFKYFHATTTSTSHLFIFFHWIQISKIFKMMNESPNTQKKLYKPIARVPMCVKL